MADIQALQYGVTNNNLPNKPTTLFVSNVNKQDASMDTYQLPLGPLGPRTLVMSSSKSSNWKPILTEEGKKLTPDYQKFLLTDVSNSADNQRAAYINKNFTKAQKETLFKGTPKVNNLAAPSEQENAKTDGTGETPKLDPKQAIEGAQKNIDQISSGIKDKEGGVRTSYGNYRYPLTLNSSSLKNKQDIIKFSMVRYSPSKLNLQNISTGSAFTKDTSTQVLGSVTMAIQSPISDTNSVSWNDSTMRPAEALAAAGALATISGGAAGAEATVGELGELVNQNNAALKTAAAAIAANAAAGTQDLLTRTTGAIANPNLELLFQAPTLRDFTFTFMLSPRDEAEAKEIVRIIRFFKQGMSVKRSSTGLFLKTPHTFKIKYEQGEGNDSKFLPKMKECALQSFSVNYTPAGNYSTYYDGSMTAYELTMAFKELTPIYDDDYSQTDDGTIGY